MVSLANFAVATEIKMSLALILNSICTFARRNVWNVETFDVSHTLLDRAEINGNYKITQKGDSG